MRVHRRIPDPVTRHPNIDRYIDRRRGRRVSGREDNRRRLFILDNDIYLADSFVTDDFFFLIFFVTAGRFSIGTLSAQDGTLRTSTEAATSSAANLIMRNLRLA